MSWPTPKAEEKVQSPEAHAKGFFSTREMAEAWATPRAEDSESSGMRVERGVADTLTAQTDIWLTPTAQQFGNKEGSFVKRNGDRGEHCHPGLESQATLWATPNTARRGTETPESKSARQLESGAGCSDLLTQAEYWPTPNAMVSQDGEDPATWEVRRQAALVKHRNGNGIGMPLTIAATTWPTPAARDQKGENSEESCLKTRSDGRGTSHTDQLPNFAVHIFSPQVQALPYGPSSSDSTPTQRRRLNPGFVCWLMGWPWWWTRAEPISFGAAATASWRSKLDAQLCFLLTGR
jgi:hypothetical protein